MEPAIVALTTPTKEVAITSTDNHQSGEESSAVKFKKQSPREQVREIFEKAKQNLITKHKMMALSTQEEEKKIDDNSPDELKP